MPIVSVKKIWTERLAQQPFPRVELEQEADRRLREVGEAAPVPADFGDVERHARPSGLARDILHVVDRAAVFGRGEDAGEMEPGGARHPRAKAAPALDQLFVDRVELVAAGLHLFEPVPLHDRGLEQCGRRVGVVFEHFGRRGAVISEVEAAVHIGVAAAPGCRDPRPIGLGDVETAEIAGRDQPVDGFEAERVQRPGRRFEPVDLGRRETRSTPPPTNRARHRRRYGNRAPAPRPWPANPGAAPAECAAS